MSLKENIEKDFLEALKGKKSSLSILRMLKSAVKNAEIEKRVKVKDLAAELDDEEMTALLRRQVKQLEEAALDFDKGERQDLVQQTKDELVTLRAYLPAALSEEELEKLVAEAIQETGAIGPADFGKAMGAAMKKAGGRADGNVVKEMVNRILNPKSQITNSK